LPLHCSGGKRIQICLRLHRLLTLWFLKWGGTDYAWSDGRIVALFVIFALTLVAFGVLQWWLGDKATIPPRIVMQRTIWSASWFAFFISGSFYLFIYFIPIYFQAVLAASSLTSSIDSLPLILANVILAVLSGVGVSRLGYINPFCYASVVFAAIGSGLLMTMTAATSTGQWIGYQILFGLGIGLGFQQPPNAPQSVLPIQDLPIGIAITLFCRNLGASLFVTAGNNVFDNQLRQGLINLAIPGIEPEALLAAGATSFRSIVPASFVTPVIGVYVAALQKTYQIGLIIACIAAVGAVCIEWKTLKRPMGPPPSRHGTVRSNASRRGSQRHSRMNSQRTARANSQRTARADSQRNGRANSRRNGRRNTEWISLDPRASNLAVPDRVKRSAWDQIRTKA
jgi:hypothetical protein